MKAFVITRMVSGQPDIDFEQFPIHGYVLAADLVGNWGAYLFSGTGAQLSALDTAPNVYGIVAVTESGDVKWPELEGVISSGARTKINNWVSSHYPAQPSIPAGWTYRRVIREIFTRMNKHFKLTHIDISDIV